MEIVERGYLDLKRINFEKKISNVTVLGIIESMLPKSIRKEWAREVQRKDSVIREANKFESFLEFLLEQKGIMEYQSDYLRAPTFENKGSNRENFNNSKCLIQKNGTHNTEDCTVYLGKSNEDRLDLLKELSA